MDSVLSHIKNLLGIQEDFLGFDPAIMTAINGAIFSLRQIGLPISADFVITGPTQTWQDLGHTPGIQNYIYLKVRIEFDPPQSSFLLTSMNSQIEELVSRLSMELEAP